MTEDFENFNEYMEYYKQQATDEKKEMLLHELKTLAVVTNQACLSLGVNNELLINRELIDLNKKEQTEDDFLEAEMVYLCSIKDSFCDLIEGLNHIAEE